MPAVQDSETEIVLPESCRDVWFDLPEHEWVRRFHDRLADWQISYWTGQRTWMCHQETRALRELQRQDENRRFGLIINRLLDGTARELTVLAGLAGNSPVPEQVHPSPTAAMYELWLADYLASGGTTAVSAVYGMGRSRAYAWAGVTEQPPGTWQQSWAQIWTADDLLALAGDLGLRLGQEAGNGPGQAAVIRSMITGELACFDGYLSGPGWCG